MKKLFCILLTLVTFCGCQAVNNRQNEALPLNLQSFSPNPFKTLTESSETLQSDEITVQTSAEISSDISQNSDYVPLSYEKQIGVWFSYIDIARWLTGKSEGEFRRNISTAFTNVKSLGANTVYVHVRPFGDALYDSELFPTSRYYTGAIGAYADFDALEIMIEEGHKLGLSVHAWVNPLRCETEENMERIPASYKLGEWYQSEEYNGSYLVKNESDGRYWLNPAYDEVRNLVCEGVAEICRNYQVDGVHIDDYFYPTTKESFDAAAFSQLESQSVSLTEFRLDNTNKLVKGMYESVKNINVRLLFGISPQGNITNNYTQLYADVKLWAGQEGYCDYILPQIYYSFDNKTQPFEQTLESWREMTCEEVKLVVGLAFYKIYEGEEFADDDGIIKRQINAVFALDEDVGVALYKYSDVFPDEEEKQQRAQKERKELFS